MPTACDLFTAAIGAFRKRDVAVATAFLRQGFFGNLYIAPLLREEEFYPQEIWYPSVEAHPRAAREYVRRYGRIWQQDPTALELLGAVWNDSLVRAELRGFINLSKNILNAGSEKERADLLDDWAQFINPERIKRTQAEILERLQKVRLRLPDQRPRLSLVLLASKDPALSLEFYRQLLDVEPVRANQVAGGYVEFEFEGVRLAIHGRDQVGQGDPYGLGPPSESLGWGALFIFQVGNLDHNYENALAVGIEIVDSHMVRPGPGGDEMRGGSVPREGGPREGGAGRRYFVVRDPSGYLLELTEEEPKGLEPI